MKLVKQISTEKYCLIEDAELTANPELYMDRTDKPLYWFNHYEDVGISYFSMRNYVQDQVDLMANGFDDYRDAEKDILGSMYIGNTTQIIGFYMAYYGYDQATAGGFHVQRLSENLVKKATCARAISRTPKIISIRIKYLTWANPDGTLNTVQANNFTSAIATFMEQYREYALLGLSYGDDREGIMDYIESTGNYSSGGLLNYTLSSDIITAYGSEENARNAMIAELADIFVKGNI